MRFQPQVMGLSRIGKEKAENVHAAKSPRHGFLNSHIRIKSLKDCVSKHNYLTKTK